jgi:DNA/RNA endonuclease G (NUC1)
MNMIKFKGIHKVVMAVMVLSALFVVSCQMKIQDSVLEVSVKKSTVDAAKGQQFVSVRCTGDWTLALLSDEGDVGWASLDVNAGSGNKTNVKLSYETNATAGSRELRIVLDNGKAWTECSMVQLAYGQEQNPTPEPEPMPDVDQTKMGWLELPAMDNPNIGYYSHSFSMNGKTYRNYSFGWSQKDRVALWVAYPLCKFYTNKTVDRTNAWALDPLLGEDSAAPFGGYAGSYARGHQLPSADRLCCYEANAQTFYGTNMTPQLNAHNEGIWSDLEGKVRSIANNSDTTYVVTGVIVSASSKKEKDSYDKSVTIPDAYFKVLLRYGKSSTLGQWNAAAFYLEHRSYSGSIGKEHSMSVDELEELTGFDFFVNLPAKVGADQAAKIEAVDPAGVALWW